MTKIRDYILYSSEKQRGFELWDSWCLLAFSLENPKVLRYMWPWTQFNLYYFILRSIDYTSWTESQGVYYLVIQQQVWKTRLYKKWCTYIFFPAEYCFSKDRIWKYKLKKQAKAKYASQNLCVHRGSNKKWREGGTLGSSTNQSQHPQHSLKRASQNFFKNLTNRLEQKWKLIWIHK